ncbi:hypothetical protein [Aquimarina longa]|uniref:hypothetical protein n=1 Tax=Aquimarina longa TaxID=1080221 RepID=UPI00078248A2|nr:hypothetical protein [Aquimarina longa]
MKFYIIIGLLFIISCKTTQKSNVTYFTNTIKVNAVIPKGFKKEIIEVGHNIEYHFLYPDSSLIYITDEKGTPTVNYKNIDSDSIAIQKSFLASMENDTLTLQGKDKHGRYWKNKKLKEVSVGYFNVPENKKTDFEQAISSIKIK